MRASTVVTDRKRGEYLGSATGGTHSVTVDDVRAAAVRMGSAQQGFPRSGHTSAGPAVLWGRTAQGSIGARAAGILALPRRTAGRCGHVFPHGSGLHGQTAGRAMGVPGSGSGAVAVGDCSTGFVTTALWGATRSGCWGTCFPASRAAVISQTAATLRQDDKRNNTSIHAIALGAREMRFMTMYSRLFLIIETMDVLTAAPRTVFTGDGTTNTGQRPEALRGFTLPESIISSQLISGFAALLSAFIQAAASKTLSAL